MEHRLLSKLSSKIAILFASLFLVIFIPTVLIFYYATLVNLREDIRREFSTNEMVFGELMKIRVDRLGESVQLLAKDFGFRSAVATHDMDTIESAVDNLAQRVEMNWAVVIDPDGNFIAGNIYSNDELPSVEELFFDANAQANDDAPVSKLIVMNNKVQLVVSMPVFAPDLIGWAVFGFDVSTPELRSLSDMASIPYDVVIVRENSTQKWEQAALSPDAGLRHDVIELIVSGIETERENDGFMTLRDQGREQLVLATPLPSEQISAPTYLIFQVQMKEALSRYHKLFFALAFIGIIGVVIVIVGSWFLSRTLTRPITLLADAADNFRQGKLSKLDLRGRSDEIGHLASRFELMAEEIIARAKELRHANATLETRVAERSVELQDSNTKLLIEVAQRRKSERAQSEAKQRAEDANRAKDDFLATMSHELRTPMNGIIGMVHYLKEAEGAKKFRDKINILDESSESLLTILNDMLDFAKIESGKIDIKEEIFSIYDLANNSANLWRENIRNKNLDFEVNLEIDQNTDFWGDKGRIIQIVNNYLNNAVKFTDSGKITFSVTQSGNVVDDTSIRISVKDTGVGVNPGDIEILFRKFSQLEAGKARRFGGTGLGLAICRQLARAMGGEVGVKSELGRGSEFWAELPLQKVVPEAKFGQGEDVLGAQSGPDHVESKLVANRKNLRILLVEDNDINIRVIKLFTEQLGFHICDEAHDGDEAVAKIIEGEETFDVILMDLRMPNMDGLTATRLIREAGKSAEELPIIALTADAMETDRQACFDVGMTDFLTKPVTPAVLEKALVNSMQASIAA